MLILPLLGERKRVKMGPESRISERSHRRGSTAATATDREAGATEGKRSEGERENITREERRTGTKERESERETETHQEAKYPDNITNPQPQPESQEVWQAT